MTVAVGSGSYQISVAAATRRSVVCSSEHCAALAASRSRAASPARYTDRDGVLMDLDTLMISVRRGTPRVTFLADTPAKWNVLSVIWVVGSPMDWAATVPTISPGTARAWR